MNKHRHQSAPGFCRVDRDPWRRFASILGALILAGCASLGDGAGALPAPARDLSTAGSTQGDAPIPAAVDGQPSTRSAAPTVHAPLPDGTVATPPVVAASSPQVARPEPATEPVDPLRPEVRIDLEDRSARLDLWVRIRRGLGVGNADGALVRKAERMYASNPEYLQRMTERGGRYLFHIVEEVQRRNLPTELALLPFIESAFNPEALSHASASGMWQFMPATGRVFNLKQNVFRDDRRDVLASTRAALDYLQKLHAMFGDWHLALAAYNWGEGNVRRAINRNRAAGKPTRYEDLRMPNETRFYIPKLQAIENIVGRPETFNVKLPRLENHPYFLTVGLERDMDVELAARLAGMSAAEFKALNPQLNRAVILAAGTSQLLMPYDNANTFIKAMQAHSGPSASWTTWTVPKSMKSSEAAQRAGMSEATFVAINHIPPRMIVQAGSTVLVPRDASKHHDVSEHLADNASLALAHESPPMRRLVIKAGKGGESVEAVARRYRVSAQQVALWNKVPTSAHFAQGAPVVLQVAAKGSRVKSTRLARKSKASPVRSARAKPASSKWAVSPAATVRR